MEFTRSLSLFNKLQNSLGIEEEFENILAKCTKSKFCDPDFYPSIPTTNSDDKFLQNAEWKYVEDVYSSNNLFDKITPNQIGQGNLSDCYLIVALIYISKYPELVKSLFHPKSSLEHGVVLIYFKVMGESLPVIIDTRLPFKSTENSKKKNKNVNYKPIFSYSRIEGSSPAWFALIEKAYAKVCGTFAAIEYGQAHIAIHNLLGWFGSVINDIPEDDIEELLYTLTDLKSQNAMLSCSINFDRLTTDFKSADALEKEIGLVTSHSYQILDVRQTMSNVFIKLRNPWCKFEWKGEYSKGSNKWTEELNRELNRPNSQDDADGTFWMQIRDFAKYFRDLSYSSPPQKNCVTKSFCGVIDGYLDRRSPCSGCRNAGCLPQWSIKFEKKCIARVHAEIAGPKTFHGLSIAYNRGKKVQTMTADIENIRDGSDCQINGFQYMINDIEYPWTVFLDRSDGCVEKPPKPSFYRITIETDSDFSLKRIQKDVSKMFSVSASGVFKPGDFDGWNPYGNRAITSCRQWSFKFSKPTTLFVRVFKNISKGRHDIIFGYTDEKISMAYKSIKAQHFFLNKDSEYEEVEFDVDLIDKNYSLCIYREKSDDESTFKFTAYSQDEFEFFELDDVDGECDMVKEVASFADIEPIIQPESFKPQNFFARNREFQVPKSKCCVLL